MKRVFSVIVSVIFIFIMTCPIFAASALVVGDIKIPTNITYNDINRFVKVTGNNRHKETHIVNAQEYKGNNNIWIVRLNFGDKHDRCEGDFVINFWPYSCDEATKKINSLPFKNVEEGTAIFGPCWYYFAIFDDVTKDLCGFAIAERIKRWPLWDDLTYFGRTYRGVYYDGDYIEPSDEKFIENHIKK